jgi:hypothetical protein
MHHPRHLRGIWSFRAAAVLFLFKCVLFAAGLAYMLMAACAQNFAWVLIGMILIGLSLLSEVIQLFCFAGAKCPLCMMSPLGRHGCAKHKRAIRLLGSHRLPVALSVLFLGRLRCPYCNEPIKLTLKSAGLRK